MKHTILLIFAVLMFSIGSSAQCTITGTTVNASTLSCSSFSGCTIVYVGNGTSATTLSMNADLNLTCLGAIQFIVRNNASIDFSPGNNRLTLGDGSSLTIQTGGSLIGGSCNASERIYIGTNLLASCNGGAGADVNFADLMSMGGTGSLSSNSPVCTNGTLNLSATSPTNGTYTYSFFGTGLPGAGTTYSSTSTYSLTAPSTAGSYVYQVKMKSSLSGNPTAVAEITVVVNSGSVSTPVVTVTQPTCSVSTGTITVTSPTGTGITYSTNGSTYTNTTGIFSSVNSGTYSITAKNSSGCVSSPTSATVNSNTNTWDGISWSNGSPPSGGQKIVFTNSYSSTTNLTGCSCQVSSAGVVINSGHTLTITDDIKVTGGGSITFEDGANLIQTNDAAVNSGSITYKRKTTALKQYDYTYWSSPVASATLSQLATNSLFYSFNTSTGYWANQSGSTTMTAGVGYIGRAPSGLTYSPTQVVQTSFTGVPNNGVVTTPIIKSAASGYNLIGNPYPSTIDADLFIAANTSATNGTIYFWTHGTAITNNVYTINDYAKYNYTGGVGTSTLAPSGGTAPTGKIAAGQGFFIEAKTGLSNGTYSATFNDAMRTSATASFFKNASAGNTTTSISQGLERHRVWLSLRSSQGAYNQMLLGYVQGATNDFDSLFDGKTLAGGNSVSIYTMVGADYLAIQGKSLPFSETDVVPVGYSTTLNGELSINLDNFDGLFTNQNVYLLDKANNTLHDLKAGPYTFVTASGNFVNRFELHFTNQALGTSVPTVTDNDIKIISGNHQLEVISPAIAIEKVEVYDVLGKLLFTQKDLNTNLYQTDSLQLAQQVLLVRVTLDNEQSFTKKTLFQ